MIYPVVSIWREHPAVINGESVPIIGYKGGLPTRSDRDMGFFKAMTSHSVCIVGSETFKSFPNGLKNRICIVLTRNKPEVRKETSNSKGGHYEFAGTPEESLEKANIIIDNHTGLKPIIHVIGGLQIYEAFMLHTTTIIRSSLQGVPALEASEEDVVRAPRVNDFEFREFTYYCSSDGELAFEVLTEKGLTGLGGYLLHAYLPNLRIALNGVPSGERVRQVLSGV